jgi:arylsulfatase A-like enzyme
VVAHALHWIDGAGVSPFLAYVHVNDAHSPYEPEPEDAAPFVDAAYRGSTDTRALLRQGQMGKLDPAGLRFLRGRYLGEVRRVDRAFGQLVEGLRQRGRLDDTIIVFVADHGEEMLEHGGTEHAKTVYQELVHVPLAVRVPGRSAARRTDPVRLVDVLPTVLQAAGVPAAARLSGTDLFGRPSPVPGYGWCTERFGVVEKYAVRADRLKLVFNNDGPALWRKGAHVELYDLARDPQEKVNLAPERPVTVAVLRHDLEAYRRASVASADGSTTLSADELEELHSLGYLR